MEDLVVAAVGGANEEASRPEGGELLTVMDDTYCCWIVRWTVHVSKVMLHLIDVKCVSRALWASCVYTFAALRKVSSAKRS